MKYIKAITNRFILGLGASAALVLIVGLLYNIMALIGFLQSFLGLIVIFTFLPLNKIGGYDGS